MKILWFCILVNSFWTSEAVTGQVFFRPKSSSVMIVNGKASLQYLVNSTAMKEAITEMEDGFREMINSTRRKIHREELKEGVDKIEAQFVRYIRSQYKNLNQVEALLTDEPRDPRSIEERSAVETAVISTYPMSKPIHTIASIIHETALFLFPPPISPDFEKIQTNFEKIEVEFNNQSRETINLLKTLEERSMLNKVMAETVLLWIRAETRIARLSRGLWASITMEKAPGWINHRMMAEGIRKLKKKVEKLGLRLLLDKISDLKFLQCRWTRAPEGALLSWEIPTTNKEEKKAVGLGICTCTMGNSR